MELTDPRESKALLRTKNTWFFLKIITNNIW